MRWVKEGDMNSKYFHSIINWKRKSGSLVGLIMNGSWVDDVSRLKEAARTFFEEKFYCLGGSNKPTLDGVAFNMISKSVFPQGLHEF